jgi:hypothetical protein
LKLREWKRNVFVKSVPDSNHSDAAGERHDVIGGTAVDDAQAADQACRIQPGADFMNLHLCKKNFQANFSLTFVDKTSCKNQQQKCFWQL